MRIYGVSQTDLSLACVSSGLKCWGLLCDLNMVPRFPPTGSAALRRSSFSLPGKTLCMYLEHLVKGCQLSDCGATSWLTMRVRGTARGSARSQDTSCPKRPALSRAQLSESVSRFSLRHEFTFLAVLCWIFPLRVKSEATPTRRRLPFEDMSDARPAHSHSVLGLVRGRPVPKLHRRKHMSSGAILSRGCCCESYAPNGDGAHIPQLLCPTCPIWPTVRARVTVGELVFPSLQSSNLVRMMRSIRESLHRSNADKLRTHSIRRVAARALMSAGGTFRQLLRADQWRGCAVRAYLDLDEEENRATMDILIEGADYEPKMLREPPHSSLRDVRSYVRMMFCLWGSSDLGSKYDLDRPVRFASGMPGPDPFLQASTPFYLVWGGPSLDSYVAGFPRPGGGQVPREGSASPGVVVLGSRIPPR